jgi:hypothetical protein
MSTTNELTAALADLAKAGMAFKTDIRSDGKKTYVVDSVALAEDELVLLHRKGALTQDGIRHYLVYRRAFDTQKDQTPHIPFVTFFHYLLQAVPLSDDKRNHLENCAECQGIAEELTHTDRGIIYPPASPSARTKVL